VIIEKLKNTMSATISFIKSPFQHPMAELTPVFALIMHVQHPIIEVKTVVVRLVCGA
jgi:hypothetical protein